MFSSRISEAYVSGEENKTLRDRVICKTEIKEYHKIEIKTEKSWFVRRAKPERRDRLRNREILFDSNIEKMQFEIEILEGIEDGDNVLTKSNYHYEDAQLI